MGNCYSAGHIAGDYFIHTDITCDNGEPQQKYRLGTVRSMLYNKYLSWVYGVDRKICHKGH